MVDFDRSLKWLLNSVLIYCSQWEPVRKLFSCVWYLFNLLLILVGYIDEEVHLLSGDR